MPLIQIKDEFSSVRGKFAAWFDTSKPRSAPKKAKQMSLKRLNDVRRARGERGLRQKSIDSYHHINKNRAEAHPDNFFACKSQVQHDNLELQANEWFTKLFDMGVLGFDYHSKKYFLADKDLEGKVRDWVEKGEPLQWDIRTLHKPVSTEAA